MASRKEQKEALRREREEREREVKAAQRRKRMVGYGVAAAMAAAAAIVVAVLALGGGDEGKVAELLPSGGEVAEQQEFDLAAAAGAAGCELRDVKASGTADHTTDLNERIKYNSNPPTTGRHFIEPVGDEAYGEAPTDEQLVHNLEHGRVVIWFKPGLSRDTRADLKALYDEDTYQMVLAPRRNMPYEIAASAWNAEPAPNGTGRLITCDRADPELWDALRAFRDEHRSNGPEPIP